jgi:hypothetical protein
MDHGESGTTRRILFDARRVCYERTRRALLHNTVRRKVTEEEEEDARPPH